LSICVREVCNLEESKFLSQPCAVRMTSGKHRFDVQLGKMGNVLFSVI